MLNAPLVLKPDSYITSKTGFSLFQKYLLPTLNYFSDCGLELAISFDDEAHVLLNMSKDDQLKTLKAGQATTLSR